MMQRERVRLYLGDCRDTLWVLPDDSVDAVVCDPPYELKQNSKSTKGFMGKTWDGSGVAFDPAAWREILRVLKPGGHMVAFGGSRTFHRVFCAIEDGGFYIVDTLMWLYGTGWPKSLNISKFIDKQAGAERPVIGTYTPPNGKEWNLTRENDRDDSEIFKVLPKRDLRVTGPATEDAARFEGYGTALKPSFEPICLSRKPIRERNVARQMIVTGTGALNISACRIPVVGEVVSTPQSDPAKRKGAVGTDLGISNADVEAFRAAQRESAERTNTLGRWPANVLFDEDAAALLDDEVGTLTSGKMAPGTARSNRKGWAGDMPETTGAGTYGDSGGPSRYFNTIKIDDTVEKEDGACGDVSPEGEDVSVGNSTRFYYVAKPSTKEKNADMPDGMINNHPTNKPEALMRYLVRLVCLPGGVVLDPFLGSGSTGVAALDEGMDFIGIELEQPSLDIAEARLENHVARKGMSS